MSRDPKKFRYPAGLFFLGLFTNFIARNVLLLALGLLLLVVGLWNRWCLLAGLSFLAMDLLMSLVQQLRFRHTALTSTDPKLKDLQDAIASGDWRSGMQAWAAREHIHDDK